MRKLIKTPAIIILSVATLSQCVVKRDTAASAATSAALAKKIAQGLAGGGTTAPSSLQPGAPAAALTMNCTYPTVSGYSSVLSCTSDTFDYYWAVATDSSISGYEKLKNLSMTDSGQTYQINGQINFAGSYASSFSANYTTITTNSNMTFNGTLAISGADSFSVTYKNFKVTTVGTYTTGSAAYSYNHTCSGTLTVEGIDYAVLGDCTIAN